MSDPHLGTPSGKPRARALGVPLAGLPGPANAITDVPGVEVGYATLIAGDDVRTGVTAIQPRGRERPGDPCAAGFHSFNGNGEMTGVSWIEESGTMSGPIALTNTHAIGTAHAGDRALDRPASSATRRSVAAASHRRDVGRLPQRHQRRPRHRGHHP